MTPEELESVVTGLAEKIVFLRAVSILQECRITVLKKNFSAIAEKGGAKPIHGSSVEEHLDSASWALVNDRLAAISDDDPGLASALRKILDTGKSGPA